MYLPQIFFFSYYVRNLYILFLRLQPSEDITSSSLLSSFSHLRTIIEKRENQVQLSPKTENTPERRDTKYLRRPSGNPNLTQAKIERRVSGNPNLAAFNQQQLPKRRSGSSISVRERRITPGEGQRRTAFMNNRSYHARLKGTDDKMKSDIEKMPLTKYE